MSARRPLRFASRADAIAQLRGALQRGTWPRVHMSLMVMLTGAAGFLASVLLLAAGVASMALRYPIACLAAYACFLCLLGVWIRWQRRGGSVDLGLDLPDVPGPPGGWVGGGGRSGGGGASAGFDAPYLPNAAGTPALHSPSPGSRLDDAGAWDVDFDVEAIPVLLAVAVAALLLSSLFVVWAAPALLAELLLDALLAAGLYRHVRRIEARDWLHTAVRRTWLPFVLTTLALGLVGAGLQAMAPEADSLGEVLARLQ
jgi:hypothetical protein